jgi:purine-binding chemotaxis protein CheW
MVVEAGPRRDQPIPTPPDGAAGEEPRLYLTCTMAGMSYLVPTGVVREVEEVGAVTPVPATPQWLRGVMNLRGTIIAVVDLAHFLGLTAAPGNSAEALICALDDELTLALAVDTVSTIRTLAQTEILPLPEQAAAETRDPVFQYLTGLYRVTPGDADGLLGVLDLTGLLRTLIAERLGVPG